MNRTDNLENLRYPNGRFLWENKTDHAAMVRNISTIESFPSKLNGHIKSLSESHLAYLHRPGGWSIKQIVHHCADSHMNAFIRFKLALTKDHPAILPYDEATWAILPDTVDCHISASLQILSGLHQRWGILLHMHKSQLKHHAYFHPEQEKLIHLDEALANYAWHCNHHFAHIKQALAQMFS